MDLEEAKKLIDAEKKQRCIDFSDKLKVLMEEYKIVLEPSILINGVSLPLASFFQPEIIGLNVKTID